MLEVVPLDYNQISSVKDWRSIANYEVAIENREGEKLIGPRAFKSLGSSTARFYDIASARPILSSKLGKVDGLIVKAYRAVIHSIIHSPIGLSASLSLLYHSGMELGKSLYKEYSPSTLEDLCKLLEDLGWGIVDPMPNGNIRVYECIDCSGLPYLGYPICTFEAGLLSSMLSSMANSTIRAEELRCWATGYSFCDFRIESKKPKI